jgi:hypothetical protein
LGRTLAEAERQVLPQQILHHRFGQIRFENAVLGPQPHHESVLALVALKLEDRPVGGVNLGLGGQPPSRIDVGLVVEVAHVVGDEGFAPIHHEGPIWARRQSHFVRLQEMGNFVGDNRGRSGTDDVCGNFDVVRFAVNHAQSLRQLGRRAPGLGDDGHARGVGLEHGHLERGRVWWRRHGGSNGLTE